MIIGSVDSVGWDLQFDMLQPYRRTKNFHKKILLQIFKIMNQLIGRINTSFVEWTKKLVLDMFDLKDQPNFQVYTVF